MWWKKGNKKKRKATVVKQTLYTTNIIQLDKWKKQIQSAWTVEKIRYKLTNKLFTEYWPRLKKFSVSEKNRSLHRIIYSALHLPS